VFVSWSITTTAPGRIDTIIGMADGHESAVLAVLAAAQAAIENARVLAAPAARYELRADAELVAIIQTGTGEDGRPDHAETGEMIRRIAISRAVSALPG
jgi:protein-L-isoaspartate O-methyltransferase